MGVSIRRDYPTILWSVETSMLFFSFMNNQHARLSFLIWTRKGIKVFALFPPSWVLMLQLLHTFAKRNPTSILLSKQSCSFFVLLAWYSTRIKVERRQTSRSLWWLLFSISCHRIKHQQQKGDFLCAKSRVTSLCSSESWYWRKVRYLDIIVWIKENFCKIAAVLFVPPT